MHNRLQPTSMTLLLDKIEDRLGTDYLNLPDGLKKNDWGKIIIRHSLPTFSRFFPYKIEYTVCTKTDRINDTKWFRIFPERISEGHVTIYGVQDVDRTSIYFNRRGVSYGVPGMYGAMDYIPGTYGLADIALTQIQADVASLYDTNVYPQFEYPDKIALVNSAGFDITGGLEMINVFLLIEHPESLVTISPTVYEYFEDLCSLDIENILYQKLKYFDKLETISGDIDIKISEWANAKSERKALIEEFKDKYVSYSNKHQPMMITI